MTDDWDRRCIMNILNDFYCPAVLSDDHVFSESGIYHQMIAESTHKVHVYTDSYSAESVHCYNIIMLCSVCLVFVWVI